MKFPFMYEDAFTHGNFKETFSECVDELIVQEFSEDFKIIMIQALTDAYVEQTGTVPDSHELSRLTTWLVVDKSNDPHKVSRTEYPVLSVHQQKLRARRELVNDNMENKSSSSKHRINGKRSPKSFKVFGEYE